MSYEVNIPRSGAYSGLCFTVTWIHIIIVEELAWKHNGQENKAGNNCKNILFSGGLTELWVARQGREKQKKLGSEMRNVRTFLSSIERVFPKEFFIGGILLFLQLEGRRCIFCCHTSFNFIKLSWIPAATTQLVWVTLPFPPVKWLPCFLYKVYWLWDRCRGYMALRGHSYFSTCSVISVSAEKAHFISVYVCFSPRMVWEQGSKENSHIHGSGEPLNLMAMDYIGQEFLQRFLFPESYWNQDYCFWCRF